MSNIIEFRMKPSRAARRPQHASADAAIIFFPGVRYCRAEAAEPSRENENGPQRKRRVTRRQSAQP